MKSEHLTEVKQILKQHQFKKLFSGDTENTFIQFFRYCFVGGFATVVDWALSSLLFYLAFSGSGYAASAMACHSLPDCWSTIFLVHSGFSSNPKCRTAF